jgi:hypothetical protein
MGYIRGIAESVVANHYRLTSVLIFEGYVTFVSVS